jgi:hypothetical protein
LDRVRRPTLVVLLIVVVTAGCGSDSSETTTRAGPQLEERPLSKAEFIELGDSICRNHRSRREDLESQVIDLGRLDSGDKARQVATLLRQESSNRRAEIGELGDLQPPSADAGEVNELLELLRTEAGVIDTWAAAYDDLDAVAIRRQQIRLAQTTGNTADRARAYGFEICGKQ